MYVERASMPSQRWMPVRDVDPDSVPYFSLIVVPGDSLAATPTGRRSADPTVVEEVAQQPSRNPQQPSRNHGLGGFETGASAPSSTTEHAPAEVTVVGLGPGPDHWLTPEAREVLAEVDHVVGYAPYVNRVPQRAGLTRHASGNTVEVDRARAALDLALRGDRVAVVSGGDAGVFGMAAAVFEAAEDPAYAAVRVRVLPGVSAVQAVAARAGAPIGADFAVVSLSDRLKPWSVIDRRLRAIAEADLVLAIYNPASRSRTTQVAETQKILLESRPADTVVVVGRDVGRAEESLLVTTLAELDAASIDMKCLLIIGATSTRRTASGQVWTPRFVDRSRAGS
jgi:precorrin-2 C20-methyltransferase/precorrin-3B C17-methyltransferase